MSNFKRIASLLVVAFMLLQFTAVAAPMPQDVAGTQYEEAAGLLAALDIMIGDDQGKFNAEADITRAEFAQILMKTMRLDDAVGAYAPVGTFTDVTADKYYANAVELGVGAGAINGYGDGTFGPDDKVTGMQAIKMMTYASGYSAKASIEGGYPTGYRMVANDTGMLKGVGNIKLDEPINRGVAAIICFNTLKMDMLQLVSTGAENTYKVISGQSLLTKKHDIFKFSGLVTTNEVSGLWASSSLRKGMVMIEGSTSDTFFVGATDIAGALGKYVRAYYKVDPDNGDQTIFSYEVLDNKNQIIEVPIENVDMKSSTATKVYYWEDKENDTKAKYADISLTPSLLVNGSVATDLSAISTADAGKVLFVDNDGDGTMDFVYVTAYENFVIQNIDRVEYDLFDKFGYIIDSTTSTPKSLDLDLESDDQFISIVDTDGEEVEFDTIKEWDIVSVSRSSSESVRRMAKLIVSSGNTVEGEVTEIGQNSDGEYTFTVNEQQYKLAPNYVTYITKRKMVNVGDSATFYLDAFGKIAAQKALATTDATFGLMTKYAKDLGAGDGLSIKVFADNAFAEYPLAAKTKIDGTLYKTADDMVAALDRAIEYAAMYTDGSKVAPMLFKANDEGVINYIDTTNRGANESDYTLQYKGGKKASEKLSYVSTSGILGGSTPVPATSKFIGYPTSSADLNNAKFFKSSKGSDLKSATSAADYPDVIIMTTDPKGYKLEYGLLRGAGSSTWPGGTPNHELQFFVISGTTEVLDDDGNVTIKLYGMAEAAAKTVVVDSEYYEGNLYKNIYTDTVGSLTVNPSAKRASSKILPGDVIRYITDAQGHLSEARALFLYQEKVFRDDSEGNESEAFRHFFFGLVNKMDGSLVFLQRYNTALNTPAQVLAGDANGNVVPPVWNESTCRLLDAAKFKGMLFDPGKPAGSQLSTGKYTDLYDSNTSKPSMVMFQIRANNPRGMIIFKY